MDIPNIVHEKLECMPRIFPWGLEILVIFFKLSINDSKPGKLPP